MGIDGYAEYRRREYCKDVKCPVQGQLQMTNPNTPEHEKIREVCKKACRHTTYEFHHWLIDKGYLILRRQ